MLRSIRISLLAGLVALVFAACGGSSNNPPGGQDDAGTGGGDTGSHVQFDANHDTGTTGNEGGTTTDDGGTGTCIASGGVATAGICKAAKPCTCPNDCVDPGQAGLAGSCWPKADPTNGCTNATDQPVYFDTPDNAHCFPTATVASATFSVPIGTQTTIGGTVSFSLTVNGVAFNLAQGWVEHDTTQGAWIVYLLPASYTTSINAAVIIIADAQYNTTTTIDFSTSTTSVIEFLQVTAASQVSFAMPMQGTLTLTTADTGTTGNVAGTITNLQVFEYPVELCGTNTAACP
jgi:hypothetical protein